LPRLHAFLPTGTILELGPGHGRWTQYLKDMCGELILVDLAESCIEACRARFASAANIRFHVNDGRSLSAVPDHSVDLAFSFDSLVHAEADVLGAYAHELARTLKPDGVGFIHHSNMGSHQGKAALARAIPDRLRRRLTARGLVVNLYAWRAGTPTAELFARQCDGAGLVCIGQEMIAWEYGRFLTDVISMLTPRGSRWERPNLIVRNPRFMNEARRLAQASALYVHQGFPGADVGPVASEPDE
jgi:SAM-dependent methyltransferase